MTKNGGDGREMCIISPREIAPPQGVFGTFPNLQLP